MELREITTFLQAANEQSFSKAAKILGYTQAAITIQIKQLEAELGTQLFDRIGKQVSLTQQGRIFYDYAQNIVRQLEEARSAVTTSPELNGRLSLGTIESISSALLPELLSEYHQLYPKVEISLVIDSPRVLLEQMNKNILDTVYFMDKRMYDPKWIKVLEKPEDIIFVAPSSHPYTKKDDLTLSQVIEEPFILTERNASYRHILDQYLAAYDMKVNPYLESGSTDFIIRLLRSSEGITFLPKFVVDPEISSGSLAPVNVSDFHMRIWRQIVYHKDKWVTREMEAFFELVKKHSK